MIDLIYAGAITVMAVSLIYRVVELVMEAHQELDEERREEREREERGEAE